MKLERARTFLTSVVPLPGAVNDGATSKEEDDVQPETSDAQPEPGQQPTVKSYVTVFFDEAAAAAVGSHRASVDTNTGSHSAQVSAKSKEELTVGRQFLVLSAFFRGAGESRVVDVEMEDKFARLKHMHFRTAFMSGAFFMAAGMLPSSVTALLLEEYWRFTLLLAGVCPIYLFLGFWACKRRKEYVRSSGTLQGTVLVGLLALQSFLIVLAEWFHPWFDYGIFVMHLGFIFNFSPLGPGAILRVTVPFGIVPYCLLLILYLTSDFSYGKIAWGIEGWYDSVIEEGCFLTNWPSALEAKQRIIVPIFVVLLQALVVMRRDHSLRVDTLTKENMQSQQRLLAIEKQRNEGLLRSMLPWQIIEAMKANQTPKPQLYPNVTVVFIEICDFHGVCQQLSPDNVMEVLNVIYHEFDRLSDLLCVYKVETVMQVYMAVVGCPDAVINHADVAAHFAMAAQRSMNHLRPRIERTTRASNPVQQSTMDGTSDGCGLQIRVGLNSGPLRAGIVGMESPRWKLVGDTVNTASRMESTCEPGKIQVSQSTQMGLSDGMFELEDRGEISVKGKGTMQTAYLLGYSGDNGSYDRHRVLIEEFRKPNVSMEAMASPRGLGPWVHDRHFLERPRSNSSSSSGVDLELRSCRSDDVDKDDSTFSVEEAQVSADRGISSCPPNLFSRAKSFELHDKHAHFESQRRSKSKEQSEDAAAGRPSPAELDLRDSDTSSALVMGARTVRSRQRQVGYNRMVNVISAALGREAGHQETDFLQACRSGVRPLSAKAVKCSEWLEGLFLLVPPSQKMPHWIEELQRNSLEYLRDVMPQRISLARKITCVVLFVLSIISMMDNATHKTLEDEATFRQVVLIRNGANNLVLIIYLMILGSVNAVSLRFSQYLTMAMLMAQIAALMVSSLFLYKSESVACASAVMLGSITLFYSVCTLRQRLFVCSFTLAFYVGARALSCPRKSVGGFLDSVANIGFLVAFLGFMACGVRLQEHLSQVAHYEQRRVKQKLQRIMQAKAAGSVLLNSLLPAHVMGLVCEGVSPIAEYHSDITIIFTDIKGFTSFSSKISPIELFTVLSSMFAAFDEVITNWGLHKVEIIGDAYFISAGCPADEEAIKPPEYAMRAVEVGLALQRSLPTVCDDPNVTMRVGLHTGSVVAGVVGKKGPRYHLFGSAVGYAEKMESSGIPGRVQISDATHRMLVDSGKSYEFEEREVLLEGEEGPQRTWLVNRSNSSEAMCIQMKLAQRRHRAMTTRSRTVGEALVDP